MWRYQWEGKIQRAGFNPYVHAPDDPKLEPVRAEFPEWQKINHRDFRAIYPPGAELLFAGLSGISDRPLLYKLLFTARGSGDDRRSLAFVRRNFALRECGVVRLESTGRLQLRRCGSFRQFDDFADDRRDSVPDALRGRDGFTEEMVSGSRRLRGLRDCHLGQARSRPPPPDCCVFALGFRAITLLVSVGIPALLSTFYGYPKIHIWESLGRFAHVTRLNDLFWWLIEDTVWPNPHQKNYHYNVIVIVCVALVSLLFWRNWKRGMIWAFGTSRLS